MQVKAVRRSDGEWRHECGKTINGVYWMRVGCSHLDPRSAISHASRLEEAYVSPLRAPSEPLTNVPSLPEVGGSLGPRRRDPRRRGQRRP